MVSDVQRKQTGLFHGLVLELNEIFRGQSHFLHKTVVCYIVGFGLYTEHIDALNIDGNSENISDTARAFDHPGGF